MMDKIIDSIRNWEYLSSIPESINGFTLNRLLQIEKTKYYIFAYENNQLHRKLTVLYDMATKDFYGQKSVGLNEFYDVDLITADIKIFEGNLRQRLEKTVLSLGEFNEKNLSSVILETNILQWTYIQQLPHKSHGFELFILPSQPLKTINGSYIILDYSDFSSCSNFVVCYNVFRNEFFADMKICNQPRTTNSFDAVNLENLQEVLHNNLQDTLQTIRMEIDSLVENKAE